jgi:guanyl-specific ribonuclease Sa
VSLHSLERSGGWNSDTTAADGSFTFRGLAAGRYQLSATHAGYLDSSRGQRRAEQANGVIVALTAGQEIGDAVVRLTPTGVIAGRIVNEREEPMPGVYVQTMKASYRNGYREFSDARAGFTDDRGEFRVWGLAPGRYYIRVTNPRRSERGPSAGDVYVPMFYPSVVDPVQAQSVELHPGEELNGINFTLGPSHTVHVRGRVLTSNAAPAKGAQVTLSQAGNSSYSLDAESDATGKFDIPAVPAGSYVVAAELQEGSESTHPLIGRTTVQVGDTNFDAGDIAVFPAATVSGRVVAEGDRKPNLKGTSASLVPIGSSSYANSARAVIQPDGSFTFHDVTEGNYHFVLPSTPAGYYVQTGNGSNAADAGVQVSHGHAASVEIRLAFGAGRIQGVAYKDKDNRKIAPAVMVVLIPDAKRRGDSQYYRAAKADQSGAFFLEGIPPGDYSLFAWDDVDRDAYMDPDFMQQYEGAGIPVHVEQGSSLSFELQLVNQSQNESQ